MNAKSILVLSSVAAMVAVLPVTALAADADARSQAGEPPAITKTPRQMGEHPAVLVNRNWGEHGYDYASKFYLHPASLELLAEAPRGMSEHPAVLVQENWSKRDYDYASKFYRHPASLELLAEAPRGMGEHPAALVARSR
jgi:hypothetical protein